MKQKIGWALSGLMMAAIGMSAVMKLMPNSPAAEPWVSQFGYPMGALVPIGVVEILCVLVYAVPRTSVLGAILLTGYLGGAIATHVRIQDVFVGPLVMGVLVWLGLWLREERLQKLLPLKA